MIETPQIVELPAQKLAAIRLNIPRNEIQNVMGPGIMEIFGALGSQGIQPAGPWLSHHFKMVPDTFDFEICVPVNQDVEPTGRVVMSSLPAHKVARTVYQGGYEGLGDAWGEFMDWITAQNLSPAEDLWEVYLAGPESSSNPADWKTQLNKPIA
ncbi:MAG TPA: GyrI-like domain-containing protein [Fimbriimonas sp.]|nr:GyrI-like domain-containing protein [Fimbriimonas sp.]